jgi:DNA ligase-1
MNFVSLYRKIDQTNSTLDKVDALREFFVLADRDESDLTISLILGNLPPRRLKTKDLLSIVLQKTNVPEWLFDEAYASVGDLAETISLMVAKPESTAFEGDLSIWLKENLSTPEKSLAVILESFDRYDAFSVMVLLKLLLGGLRMGVARGLLIKSLAKAFDLPEANVAHSMMGRGDYKSGGEISYVEQLKSGSWNDPSKHALPYPFALASPIDDQDGVESLGDPSEWEVEWKWDGIRGQWIFRNEKIAIWSRGEELLTDRFPELHPPHIAFESLVLDGEILSWKPDELSPMPFQSLQTRIGRKKLSEKVLADAPVRFLAYDCRE